MRTDQRHSVNLTRLKSIRVVFVCSAELTYICIYVAPTDIAFNKVHPTLVRSFVCA